MMLMVRLIFIVAKLLTFLLIARCIISWMPSAKVQYHPISLFIMQVTDPILEPFRKLIPTHRFGVDISPAIAIIVIWLLARLLASAFIP